jgi:hypothetical protein
LNIPAFLHSFFHSLFPSFMQCGVCIIHNILRRAFFHLLGLESPQARIRLAAMIDSANCVLVSGA